MNQLTLLAFESLQRPVARLQLRGGGRHGRRPSVEETNLSTSTGRRTQLFHLIFTQSGSHLLDHPCTFTFLFMALKWGRATRSSSENEWRMLNCFCSSVIPLPQKGNFWQWSTGPKIITCYGLRETGRKKLRSPAFCGWVNHKLITQFHATHGK